MSHTRLLAIALLLSLTSSQVSAQQTARGSVELVATLTGHTKSIEAIEFSHDGHSVATSSKDKTIRLWNIATGECFATLVGDGGDTLARGAVHPPPISGRLPLSQCV